MDQRSKKRQRGAIGAAVVLSVAVCGIIVISSARSNNIHNNNSGSNGHSSLRRLTHPDPEDDAWPDRKPREHRGNDGNPDRMPVMYGDSHGDSDWPDRNKKREPSRGDDSDRTGPRSREHKGDAVDSNSKSNPMSAIVVCPDGRDPIPNTFCGRGPNRANCAEDQFCFVEPADGWAVCCPNPIPDREVSMMHGDDHGDDHGEGNLMCKILSKKACVKADECTYDNKSKICSPTSSSSEVAPEPVAVAPPSMHDYCAQKMPKECDRHAMCQLNKKRDCVPAAGAGDIDPLFLHGSDGSDHCVPKTRRECKQDKTCKYHPTTGSCSLKVKEVDKVEVEEDSGTDKAKETTTTTTGTTTTIRPALYWPRNAGDGYHECVYSSDYPEMYSNLKGKPILFHTHEMCCSVYHPCVGEEDAVEPVISSSSTRATAPAESSTRATPPDNDASTASTGGAPVVDVTVTNATTLSSEPPRDDESTGATTEPVVPIVTDPTKPDPPMSHPARPTDPTTNDPGTSATDSVPFLTDATPTEPQVSSSSSTTASFDELAPGYDECALGPSAPPELVDACPENEFCALDMGACNNSGDVDAVQYGICARHSVMCMEMWDPVCGCDGETYGNSCKAHAAGANVARMGECEDFGDAVDVTVTTDPTQDWGTTSASGATTVPVVVVMTDPTTEDYGTTTDYVSTTITSPTTSEQEASSTITSTSTTSQFDDPMPRYDQTDIESGNECAIGPLAPPELVDACPENEFCSLKMGACNDSSSSSEVVQYGKCERKSSMCMEMWDPVCGCDGNEYGNSCKAHAAGANVLSTGACRAPLGEDVEVGREAPTAPTEMSTSTEWTTEFTTSATESDELTAPKVPPTRPTEPTTVLADIVTKPAQDIKPTKCSISLGATKLEQQASCGPDQFCWLEIGACDKKVGKDAIHHGMCAPKVHVCEEDMDDHPVCGCDWKTYKNLCEAHAMGVSISKMGACERQIVKDADLVKDVEKHPPAEELMKECVVGDPTITSSLYQDMMCADHEYCHLRDGSCLDDDLLYENSMRFGLCTPKPKVCNKKYAPVCGCDGTTYGNLCTAHGAGASIAMEGKCEKRDVPEILIPKDTIEVLPEIPEPDVSPGDVKTEPAQEVKPVKCSVGPKLMQQTSCGPDEFCWLKMGTCDREADIHHGMCKPKKHVCLEDIVDPPVCGCDWKTYKSPCEAHAQGVSILKMEACDRPIVKDAELVKDVEEPPATEEAKECVVGDPKMCGDHEYCHLRDETCLDDGLLDDNGMRFGVCTPKPKVCIMTHDPVCGCDGTTYGNLCTAHGAGASIATKGECKMLDITQVFAEIPMPDVFPDLSDVFSDVFPWMSGMPEPRDREDDVETASKLDEGIGPVGQYGQCSDDSNCEGDLVCHPSKLQCTCNTLTGGGCSKPGQICGVSAGLYCPQGGCLPSCSCDWDSDADDGSNGCDVGEVCRQPCAIADAGHMCFKSNEKRDCDHYGEGYMCRDSNGDGKIDKVDGAAGCVPQRTRPQLKDPDSP